MPLSCRRTCKTIFLSDGEISSVNEFQNIFSNFYYEFIPPGTENNINILPAICRETSKTCTIIVDRLQCLLNGDNNDTHKKDHFVKNTGLFRKW